MQKVSGHDRERSLPARTNVYSAYRSVPIRSNWNILKMFRPTTIVPDHVPLTFCIVHRHDPIGESMYTHLTIRKFSWITRKCCVSQGIACMWKIAVVISLFRADRDGVCCISAVITMNSILLTAVFLAIFYVNAVSSQGWVQLLFMYNTTYFFEKCWQNTNRWSQTVIKRNFYTFPEFNVRMKSYRTSSELATIGNGLLHRVRIKRYHFIFDYNSRISLSIFILLNLWKQE